MVFLKPLNGDLHPRKVICFDKTMDSFIAQIGGTRFLDSLFLLGDNMDIAGLGYQKIRFNSRHPQESFIK